MASSSVTFSSSASSSKSELAADVTDGFLFCGEFVTFVEKYLKPKIPKTNSIAITLSIIHFFLEEGTGLVVVVVLMVGVGEVEFDSISLVSMMVVVILFVKKKGGGRTAVVAFICYSKKILIGS